jgi:general secretion pathway protein D
VRSSPLRLRVWIPLALAAGCATTERLHREGIDAFQQGAYEEAIRSLEEAARRDPANLQHLLDLRLAREAGVQRLLAAADAARAGGDSEKATRTYRRVLTIEPLNDRARHGREAVDADRPRHLERTAKAHQLLVAKKLDAAEAEVRAVLSEDPDFAAANALQSRIDQARGPAAAVRRLKAREDRPVTLQFRDAPTKMVFEALSRQTGVNFVFDKDVRSDGKTTIFVDQVPVEQAIELILAQNQLGRQVLSENTVLIYPDTPAKQKDYQDQIVHTFYLTNAAPKDAETMLKTVLGTKTLFVDERSSTLVMRDTPEHVRMAEKLVASLDVPEPEVIMEVEVLEITHSLAQQLGINYPGNVAFSPTKPPNSAASGVAGLVLSDLGKQSADTIAVSNLGVSVDISKMVGVTNVLSSPRIRARNKEKAKILVGNRLPVVTSGTSATTGGSFSTSNVQYIDVGLTLEVQPAIHNDGNVAIKIGLEVSSIIKQITVPIGNGATTLAYQIGTRNASTVLQLRDGETQVLAGLIQDNDQRNSTHIPGLGDIPILGRLFGSSGKNRDKSEIVLSITPRVVRAQPRPSSETTEFWFGSESQARSAPLGGGAPPPSPGAPPYDEEVVPGGGPLGAAGKLPPAPGGPRSVPARIDAATAPPPPPPHQEAAGAAAPDSTTAAPETKGTPSDAKVAAPDPTSVASKPAERADASVAPAVQGAGPRVSIEGPGMAKVGDEIGVSVKLASTSALGRIRTQVAFDPSALQLVTAEPGDLASSGAPKVETKPGRVQLELAGAEGAPVRGGGSLIRLRLRAIAARPAVTVATQVVLIGESGVAVAATQATPLQIAVSR